MRIVLLLLISLTLTIYSCKKEYNVPPEIPPQESFVTNFSDFNTKVFTDTTMINWWHSATNVGVWSFIITVDLAVPLASYVEAVKNHTPVYQSDNTWLWEYSFKTPGNTHTAKLFGTVNSETIDWEMYITKDGVYVDFLWYSGTSFIDRSSVNWVLYDNPESSTELLSVFYKKTTVNSGNITYTNIIPGDPENGAYIKYGNDAEFEFNAYYYIYNKGQDNLIEIEWDQIAKNGRVKDKRKFSDTIWHCWDFEQKDVNCD